MPSRTPLIEQVSRAFSEHGWGAAITALIGGILVLAAAVVRKAFTNEAAVLRIEKAFISKIDTWEAQRQRDRKEINDQLSKISKRIDGLYDRRGEQ